MRRDHLPADSTIADRVKRRIDGIDGLRALSWVGVLAAHAESGPGWIGRMGVGVFFAVSGFLISGIVLRLPATGQALIEFYFRRCLRILVPYFAFLGLAAAVVCVFIPAERNHFVEMLPFALTFATDLKSMGTGLTLGHTWSICVEERFYLFWPLALLLFGRFRASPRILFALVVATWTAVPLLAPKWFPGFNLHDQAYWFLPWPLLAGAGVAIFQLDTFFRTRSPWLNAVLVVFSLGGYAWFTSMLDPAENGWDKTHGMGVVFSVVPGILCAVSIGAATHLGNVLNNVPGSALCWIGRLSYSAYLIHVPFAIKAHELTEGFIAARWGFIVAAFWCLPCAWAFYKIFEEPALRWREKAMQNHRIVFCGALLQVVLVSAGLLYVAYFLPRTFLHFFTAYPR